MRRAQPGRQSISDDRLVQHRRRFRPTPSAQTQRAAQNVELTTATTLPRRRIARAWAAVPGNGKPRWPDRRCRFRRTRCAAPRSDMAIALRESNGCRSDVDRHAVPPHQPGSLIRHRKTCRRRRDLDRECHSSLRNRGAGRVEIVAGDGGIDRETERSCRRCVGDTE